MNTLEYFKSINWREINIREIIQGCAEAYLTDVESRDPAYGNVIKYRLKQCSTCQLFTGTVCDPTQTALDINGNEVSGCGCNIKCKTALKDSECPRKFWLAIK